jgi:ketosteroid isomerase-like protein
MPTFSTDEILETHRLYIDTRNRIGAGELGWAALAEFFTEDATFVDPAWGRVDGRDNLIEFFTKSMAGLEDWFFPHEWEAIDGNYLITGWQNRLPGRRADGTYYQAPGMSRMLYAGNGKFCYEQDLLNMVHVMELVKESGRQLGKNVNMPPTDPVRMCSWER